MEMRFQQSPKETAAMNTAELRSNFLIENLMQENKLSLVYSHYDRVITGGVKPVNETVALHNEAELRSDYFLERREMGIINVGGSGTVIADGTTYSFEKLSCVYLGKGTKDVSFASADADNPAIFFIISTPAHHSYPNTNA